MRVTFDAHACAVWEGKELNTYVIVLADDEQTPKCWVELHKSSETEGQSIDHGISGYCVVTDSGAVYYGGINSCILENGQIILDFDEEATITLGVNGYRINLMSSVAMDPLRSGLKMLFTAGEDRPRYLIL